MKKLEITLDLENEEKTGLKDKHIDSGGNFKHKTSSQYKLFPFNTKWDNSFIHEFTYFNGILGETYRRVLGKELPKELKTDTDYDLNLKNKIVNKATSLTVTDDDVEGEIKLKQFISELFFEGNNLFCFDKVTLPYLSFKTNNATLKQIGSFISEVFLSSEDSFENKGSDNENILYDLVKNSLPELTDKKSKPFGYTIWHKEVVELFKNDYTFLKSQERAFLKNIGQLLKFYYFIYISKIALSLDDFYYENDHPLYFLLETEVVSKNREGFRSGWSMLEKKIAPLFTHANILELLNYIKVDNIPLGNYKEIKEKWDDFSESDKEVLLSKINELELFYREAITMPNTGWDKCFEVLNNQVEFNKMTCSLEKAIYKFWFVIDYQFKNTARHKPYKSYSLWFIEFCKANFIKRRGRIGYTLKMDQELLLFLTRLCIGNESKIRLKSLWEELKKRGVNFDESSKMEVVRLFEKINLIEKKSDSGDAQYVRTIL